VHPEIKMDRSDRSSAPLGLALVFLSLTIVPVSLMIAGYDVSVSPSLSAAVEAWRGIAGVLGNSSQSASDTELSLVKKYSFAEETKTAAIEEPVVKEACTKSLDADFEPGFEASWVANEPATIPAPAPAPEVVHRKAPAKTWHSSATSRNVVLARLQQTITSQLPALVRTAEAAEAKTATCPEREAALLRARELVRRSRALGEAFKTVQLQKDVQVFVKMKPIALFAPPEMWVSDEDQLIVGEPATEVFRNAGPRFGVGASEEPESFEFLLDFWF
jgi:hypothetical protein